MTDDPKPYTKTATTDDVAAAMDRVMTTRRKGGAGWLLLPHVALAWAWGLLELWACVVEAWP